MKKTITYAEGAIDAQIENTQIMIQFLKDLETMKFADAKKLMDDRAREMELKYFDDKRRGDEDEQNG